MAIIPRGIWLPKPLHLIRREINYVWDGLVRNSILRPVLKPVQNSLDIIADKIADKIREYKQSNLEFVEPQKNKNSPRDRNFKISKREGLNDAEQKPIPFFLMSAAEGDLYKKMSHAQRLEFAEKRAAEMAAEREAEREANSPKGIAKSQLKTELNKFDYHVQSAQAAREDYLKFEQWGVSTDHADKKALISIAEKFADEGRFNSGYRDTVDADDYDPIGEWVEMSARILNINTLTCHFFANFLHFFCAFYAGLIICR